MTLEASTKKILDELEREVLKAEDANFQFAVNYYLSGTKHEFEHSHFFDEFSCEPLTREILTKAYNLLGYCKFKKEITKLSTTVTQKLINSCDTSFTLLAQLASFVNYDYCDKLARENKFSDKLKFLVTFKALESCFMVPKDYRNVSDWNIKRCNQWMNKFPFPSPAIMSILNTPEMALTVNVDDDWLINELVSSL